MSANRWFSEDRFSGQNPSSALAEGCSSRPPPFPPDPPDLNPLSSLSDFPPLSPISSSSPLQHSPQTAYIEPERVVLALPAHHKSTPVVVSAQAQAIINSSNNFSTQNPRSENLATVTVEKTVAQTDGLLSLPPPKVTRLYLNPSQAGTPSHLLPDVVNTTVVSGKSAVGIELATSGLSAAPVVVPHLPGTVTTQDATNKASPLLPLPKISHPTEHSPVSALAGIDGQTPGAMEKDISNPQTAHQPLPPNQSTKTWAQKLKKDADRTLQRLAPVDFSPEGIPRVVIPDAVFQEGAEIHKDFASLESQRKWMNLQETW